MISTPGVRVHATSASFLSSCGELLLAQLAMNQHLLSNATSTPVEAAARLLLSVHDDEGRVVAAVVLAQVRDFVAATVGGELTPEAAELVVATARESHAALLARVSLSMGGAASRRAFADAFLRASPGVAATPGLSVAAMELRGACAVAGARRPGAPRQVRGGLAPPTEALAPLGAESCECTEAVLGTLVAWHQGFCRDALGAVQAPPSAKESRETLHAAASRGALYVWVAEGQGPVAMAAVGRQLLEIGVSLSLVYTPPEHRGNGYAKQLLSFMCAEISKQGKRVFLLADADSSFGTVRLYEKLGFSNDGEYGDIRFSPAATLP